MDLFDLPTHLPNASANETTDVPNVPEGKDTVSPSVPTNTQDGLEESDEEATAKPVFIPGTSITLQTEEDIQKWIEERKKNWPSKRNVERKKAEVASSGNKRKQEESTNSNKKSKQICKFYKQNKSCKFGNNCKNIHETESDFTTINNIKTRLVKPFENNYYTKENASENSSLYKMLVKKDQFELENEKFIEFLYYLEQKGLIKHDFNASD